MPNYGIVFVPDDLVTNEYSTQNGVNLGQLAIAQPSQRGFAFGLAGAVNLAAGKVNQSALPIANHNNVTCDVARAVGDNEISATLGATAAAADLYKDGLVHVNDVTGEGTVYAVGEHLANAGSAVLTVKLAGGSTVKVALDTSSQVTFSHNPYKNVLIHASPNTAGLVGVLGVPLTAATFGWFQKTGNAPVLTDGTLVIGNTARVSDAVDGAVEPLDRDGTAEDESAVGIVAVVNATTEYSLITLNI